ncbi:MAG: mannose-6-phosphate isomerase, class I [Gammaproteobacteria bacterium]|nr:MAG: mannose-6-phosphate isomerase, class I [Gammaproteobacteria bacterium]
MYRLYNQIKDYAWGSHSAMAALFGLPNPDNQPQAEMWLGAHPAGCSAIITDNGPVGLDDFIRTNPGNILGQKTAKHFQTLPFLLKILAAEMPLSIQVHPNKLSAERGFADENARRIPLDAPQRNYKDDNHKPELIYALTPFQALNGFRELAEMIDLFVQAEISSLQQPIAALQQQTDKQGLRRFFTTVMTLTTDIRQQAIKELLRHIGTKGDDIGAKTAFALIKQLSELYPDDVGLFAPLLLNIVTLKPREAMFLYAETPHAYIHGTGIEIMANSDNVLRAGLTPKYIDVKELLEHIDYTPKSFSTLKLHPQTVDAGHKKFPVPVSDFSFAVIRVTKPKPIAVSSAEILLCLSGKVIITDNTGGQNITLQRGQSVFIPASTGAYCLDGAGEIVRAYSGI